ncbi:DUF4381 family protein [Variovorax sp. HJSM1_2]|uniref:DUF4381 family protein n=1 Tax=Variovorax sp. HJSM1_2 TaxID=3366263 RepID=UPI003BCD4F51
MSTPLPGAQNAAPALSPKASEALSALKDVIAPPEVPWTPQTPAWAVLGVVLLLALLWLAWRALRRYRANRYRREALAELQRLEPQWDAGDQPRTQALLALAALLKRTALAAWPREEVAALSGEAWSHFLRTHAGSAKTSAPTLDKLLIDTEYRGSAALANLSSSDARALAQACRQWITSHRVPA